MGTKRLTGYSVRPHLALIQLSRTNHRAMQLPLRLSQVTILSFCNQSDRLKPPSKCRLTIVRCTITCTTDRQPTESICYLLECTCWCGTRVAVRRSNTNATTSDTHRRNSRGLNGCCRPVEFHGKSSCFPRHSQHPRLTWFGEEEHNVFTTGLKLEWNSPVHGI
jgi:hypothetical protein